MEAVIFDIEASCEDKNITKNYPMETIEIGAVKVKDSKIIETFQTFIKPEYSQSLTPFCTNLTGITYKDLKDAPTFNEAIVDFYDFIYGLPIYSCGEFDRKFLSRELSEKGNSYTHKLALNAIMSNHRNLKMLFNRVTNKKMVGMLGMAKEMGVEISGTHHRALDDALNLAEIFIKLEQKREEKLTTVFSSKMPEIVESINKIHGRNYVIEDNLISEWNQDPMTTAEFLDYWAHVITADHKSNSEKYIVSGDLNKLDLLKSMNSLERRFKAFF